MQKNSISREITQLFRRHANDRSGQEILERLSMAPVYIYGAGVVGGRIYQILRDAGVAMGGFFDQNGRPETRYFDLPVHPADDRGIGTEIKKESLVIIAFLRPNAELQARKDWLASLGYQQVCSFFDLYRTLMAHRQTTTRTETAVKHWGDGLTNVEEKAVQVASWLADDESRDVFRNYLRVIFESNPDCFAKPSAQPQYFVNEVAWARGYARCIDGGAFDGDTALELKKRKGLIEAIALFEPDEQNFRQLCRNLQQTRVAKEQIFFPCGLWKHSARVRFQTGWHSLSAISSTGNACIQCVALDEAVYDFAPTFIKLDVEGAELEALSGSQKIIQQYTPDLAISVYHKIEDLWEIPLLIKHLHAGYRFYLRCHDTLGKETVCYAVQPDVKSKKI